MLKIISLVFVILNLIPSLAFASIESTPFRTYPTSPYQANSLAIQLRSAFPTKRTELFATSSMSSIWAQSEEFNLDYYQNQAFIGTQWRVSRKLSAEVKYQYSWAGDNKLDSITMNFHDLFDIGQNGRDEVDKHQFTIRSDKYNLNLANFQNEKMVNALSGYLQYQLFDNRNQSLSLGGSLYYNKVSNGLFKEDSFEQGIQVNYSMFMGAHSVFSTLGATHRNNDDLLNSLPVKSISGAWAVGYGYRFFRSNEFMIQYHGFSGVLKDISEFNKPSHEVVLGYRHYRRNAVYEISLTENVVNMDNSADIAFTGGVRFFL